MADFHATFVAPKTVEGFLSGPLAVHVDGVSVRTITITRRPSAGACPKTAMQSKSSMAP